MHRAHVLSQGSLIPRHHIILSDFGDRQVVDIGRLVREGTPLIEILEQVEKLALTEAMHAGRNQYAPMTGLPALREQIARKTERLYGRRVNAETEVTVTSGATEALFAAIAAIVRDGDEVIVLDPCYDSYEPAIELNGGRPVHVPLDARDFSPDWQRNSDAITPKPHLILINTPHTHVGTLCSPADPAELAALIRTTGIPARSASRL